MFFIADGPLIWAENLEAFKCSFSKSRKRLKEALMLFEKQNRCEELQCKARLTPHKIIL